MKPSSWDKQRGLALPLERAAGQSNQTNNLSENVVGLDVSHHTHVFRGAGRSFFLDILFHRMSDSRCWRQLSFCSRRKSSSANCEQPKLQPIGIPKNGCCRQSASG